jgi:hypothetical protein
MADPDAIEIGFDHIAGDLSCRGNSMVWDTSDAGPGLFPRVYQLNKVNGKRSGQCRRSTAVSQYGPSGLYPF